MTLSRSIFAEPLRFLYERTTTPRLVTFSEHQLTD